MLVLVVTCIWMGGGCMDMTDDVDSELVEEEALERDDSPTRQVATPDELAPESTTSLGPQSFSFQLSCTRSGKAWGTYPNGTHWAYCDHGDRNRVSPQYSEMSASRWNACPGDISNCNGYLHCAPTCP